MPKLHDTIQTHEHLPVSAECFPDQAFDTISPDSFPFNPFCHDQTNTRIVNIDGLYIQSQRETFEHDPIPQHSAKLISFSQLALPG